VRSNATSLQMAAAQVDIARANHGKRWREPFPLTGTGRISATCSPARVR
jgi:hypothetical protein